MTRYSDILRDENGGPIAGVRVEVGLSSSDALANLTDDSGSPLPNPFMNDDDGGIVFHTDPGIYNLIYYRGGRRLGRDLNTTIGDVSTLPPGSVADFLGTATDVAPSQRAIAEGYAATGGAAMVGFSQAGVGAATRSLQAKLRAIEISVNDFGAVGDGQVSSEAANNAAILAAVVYATMVKGDHDVVLTFEPGDYVHGNVVINESGIILEGKNQARLLYSGTTGFGIEIKAPGYPADPNARIYRSGIRGFKIGNYSSDAVSGTTVYLENVQDAVIEDMRWGQYPKKPYNPIKAKRCTNLYVENLNGSNAAGTGLIFEEVVGLKGGVIVSNVNGGYGAIYDQVTGNQLTDVQCYGNALGGAIQQNTVGASIISDHSAYWQISAWDMDSNGNHNLRLLGLRDSKVLNSWTSAHNVATADLAGMDMVDCHNVQVIGHEALNNNGPGIIVDTLSTDVHISNSLVNGNGRITGSANRIGIVHQGSGSINGNTCGAHPDLSGQQQYGIHIPLGNAANLMDVVDNRLVGNVVAAIYPIAATNFTGLMMKDNNDGSSKSIASASTLATQAARDSYIVTGSAAIMDITPKWDGRRVRLQWASGATASVIGGTAIKQQLPSQSPGAFGWYEAEYSVDAAAWVLCNWSLNDNT